MKSYVLVLNIEDVLKQVRPHLEDILIEILDVLDVDHSDSDELPFSVKRKMITEHWLMEILADGRGLEFLEREIKLKELNPIIVGDLDWAYRKIPITIQTQLTSSIESKRELFDQPLQLELFGNHLMLFDYL